MKTQILYLLSILAVTFFGSCNTRLSYFTQDLYEENRWTDQDLKKIQFYVSKDIVLKRQLSDGSAEIISGKIKIEDGRRVEEVVIPRGTPGTFLFSPKEDRFAVSFEEGGDSRYLIFGPSPKYRDRYVLLASEWKQERGQVTYDGKSWNVTSEEAFAALMVDLRKIQRVDVNSRVAKGRKVN